jgi:hypothetical protein
MWGREELWVHQLWLVVADRVARRVVWEAVVWAEECLALVRQQPRSSRMTLAFDSSERVWMLC